VSGEVADSCSRRQDMPVPPRSTFPSRALPAVRTESRVLQGIFSTGAPLAACCRRNVAQRGGGGHSVELSGDLLQRLPDTAGRRWPDAVLRKMETAFGASFSDVRIFVGPEAARIGALAFTIGSRIHFAPGQYHPETPHGQRLLGHELTHVLQQRAGRV